LQQIERDKNLETRIKRTSNKKGWIRQPKGLLQVLWERGWIDKQQIDKYTVDVAKDNNGQVVDGA
jgi:hypothetical protein